jgi:predicted acylesterase/phospholipase RssA
MHAGVLDAYEQLGVKISTISGVSGGSIIGSYYASGGSPRCLFEGLTDQRFDLQRRLLQFPNVFLLALKLEIPFVGLRLNPFSDFTRTAVQARLIDDVFLNGTTWQTLTENHAPKLLIGTTDLIHDAGVGFTSDGALHRAINSPFQSGDYQNVFLVDESSLLDMKSLASKAHPLAETTEAYRVAMSRELMRQ